MGGCEQSMLKLQHFIKPTFPCWDFGVPEHPGPISLWTQRKADSCGKECVLGVGQGARTANIRDKNADQISGTDK